MQEIYKQALMHREAMKEKVQDKDWGIASAVDDIRTKVVEEPFWQRPEGRAVTDDIQPSTMQSFYQSHTTPESNPYTLDKEQPSMQDLYQSHMPQQEDDHEHVYGKDEEDKELDSNCMRCGKSMDSEICNPDPEQMKELEERGIDL